MTDAKPRLDEFARNAPAWLIVRHFLPAPLIGELFAAIVERWSRGELTVDDVAKVDFSQGAGVLSSLAFQPPPRKLRTEDEPKDELAEIAESLRRLFQVVVWQGDQTPNLQERGDTDPYDLVQLEQALELSNRDLSSISFDGDRLEQVEALEPIVRALRALQAALARDGDATLDAVGEALGEYAGSPLLPILLKHLGDLSGDLDRWDVADTLYIDAATQLRILEGHEWGSLGSSLATIIAQSRAAAARMTQGPEAAAALLDNLASQNSHDFLVMLNASFDRLGAHLISGNWSLEVERGSTLLAPQLITAHHTQHALSNLLDGKYRDAHRWFWAALRRQLALGSANVSRETKAAFGRSMIEQLGKSLGNRHVPRDFLLGIRLLIESGKTSTVEAMSWTDQLLGVYVDLPLIEAIETLASRHAGSRVERHRVLVILLRDWIIALSPDATAVAARALQMLAAMAETFDHTGYAERNVGGSALKALGQIGKSRPEFTEESADIVVAALLRTFDRSGGIVAGDVLDAIVPYTRRLSPDVRRSTVENILGRLEQFEDGGPFQRNALNLLTSQSVIALTRDIVDPIAKRLARTLVKLALGNETEQLHLLYLLRDLDPALIEDTIDQAKLSAVVEQLSMGAGQVNSSGATACVQALLIAPAIAGRDGVEAALKGLRNILVSLYNSELGFAAADAYDPLILLSDSHAEIADSSGIEQTTMMAKLRELEKPLCRFWEHAAKRPTVLNSFALPPPTEPNRVLVHNWTFASLAFAQAIEQPEAIHAALENAAQSSALAPYMATARAVRIGHGGDQPFNVDAIADEPRDAFYAALGERLILLRGLDREAQKSAISALIERCLTVGPSGLDAGIFNAAIERDLKIQAPVCVDGYKARMRADQQLRHGLMPLLAEALTAIDF